MSKKLVGVSIDEDELERMISSARVNAAASAVLALARLGMKAMEKICGEEVKS